MSAPSCASLTACDRPCPRAAPVISATLPSSCPIVNSFRTPRCAHGAGASGASVVPPRLAGLPARETQEGRRSRDALPCSSGRAAATLVGGTAPATGYSDSPAGSGRAGLLRARTRRELRGEPGERTLIAVRYRRCLRTAGAPPRQTRGGETGNRALVARRCRRGIRPGGRERHAHRPHTARRRPLAGARRRRAVRVVAAGLRLVALHVLEGGLTVPDHAFGVGAVQRQAGEELRRHAPALARVEELARRARPARLRLAQSGEQLGLAARPL